MALRLSGATAPAPASDPAERVHALQASITAARVELRRALLDGTGTAGVRARLAGLEGELADARAAVAEERDQVAAEERAELRAAADVLARAAADRISAVLAPLAPPPAP